MRVEPQQRKRLGQDQVVTFIIGNTQLVEVDLKLDFQIHQSNLTRKIHQKLNYF